MNKTLTFLGPSSLLSLAVTTWPWPHGSMRPPDTNLTPPLSKRVGRLFRFPPRQNAAGKHGLAPPLVHRIYEPDHHGDRAFLSTVQNGVQSHHWDFCGMLDQWPHPRRCHEHRRLCLHTAGR